MNAIHKAAFECLVERIDRAEMHFDKGRFELVDSYLTDATDLLADLLTAARERRKAHRDLEPPATNGGEA